jgi:SAM-dependent methyltransferase
MEGPGASALMDYHETRLPYDRRRDVLWRTLCESYFQRLVGPDACVLDVGAGYGHFINHIRCARRIAVDRWAGMTRYLAPGVAAHVRDVTDLGVIEDRSVDLALASNLFEHLTHSDGALLLGQLRSKLRAGGSLVILQPNYRFAYREYFDDYTHVSVYSDRSLSDFLVSNGFRVVDCRARFLPLTVKGKLPVWPFLIRLYLALPWKPLGKQMLLRAVPG